MGAGPQLRDAGASGRLVSDGVNDGSVLPDEAAGFFGRHKDAEVDEARLGLQQGQDVVFAHDVDFPVASDRHFASLRIHFASSRIDCFLVWSPVFCGSGPLEAQLRGFGWLCRESCSMDSSGGSCSDLVDGQNKVGPNFAMSAGNGFSDRLWCCAAHVEINTTSSEKNSLQTCQQQFRGG